MWDYAAGETEKTDGLSGEKVDYRDASHLKDDAWITHHGFRKREEKT